MLYDLATDGTRTSRGPAVLTDFRRGRGGGSPYLVSLMLVVENSVALSDIFLWELNRLFSTTECKSLFPNHLYGYPEWLIHLELQLHPQSGCQQLRQLRGEGHEG